MKLYGFANFIEQHLVPYEYAGINLVIIEVSKWLYRGGFYCMTVINNLRYSLGYNLVALVFTYDLPTHWDRSIVKTLKSLKIESLQIF